MLSEKEIAVLYQYCEYKGVKYYDVQTELVDHLADAIEKLQIQKPDLGLRELIAEVDAQFAPDEFAMITKNKSAAIRKRYFSLYKEELLSFVKFPKLFLLCLLYALMFFFRDYTHEFYDLVLPFLSLYLSIGFFIWTKKLRLHIGYSIFHSRLPLISLQLAKWVIERLIIVIYGLFFSFLTFLHYKGLDNHPNFFTSLYPLFIVAFISAVNIQYCIRYQIITDYPKAFA